MSLAFIENLAVATCRRGGWCLVLGVDTAKSR